MTIETQYLLFTEYNARKRFSCAARSLYLAFLDIANKNNWPANLELPVENLISEAQIGKDLFYKARRELCERGLIGYEVRKGNQPTFYWLCAYKGGV